jgi:hypothetical protein
MDPLQAHSGMTKRLLQLEQGCFLLRNVLVQAASLNRQGQPPPALRATPASGGHSSVVITFQVTRSRMLLAGILSHVVIPAFS